MKYIQSAGALAKASRAAGKKMPLVWVVKYVVPPGGWLAPIDASMFHPLPLDTLGYYVFLLRHHGRFRLWNTKNLGVAHLSAAQCKRHRKVLKDAGLLFQCKVRGRTCTTILRSPLEPELRDVYQRIYDEACHFEPWGPETANEVFATTVGCPDGPSTVIPRETVIELNRLKVDMKSVGLWVALASQDFRYNWRNVTNIAQVLGMTRKTAAKHLTDLQRLGLVRCVGKSEIFVNVLIDKELQ